MNRKQFLAAMFCALLPASLMARSAWDPNLAAGVVDELLGSLSRIVEISQDEEMQPDAVMSKNARAALVDIRFLIGELERLHLALSAGKNKAQTFASYQRISNLRYSVRDYASGTEISEEVRREAETAGSLMRELDLIYL